MALLALTGAGIMFVLSGWLVANVLGATSGEPLDEAAAKQIVGQSAIGQPASTR
jgi:hypothetical protein